MKSLPTYGRKPGRYHCRMTSPAEQTDLALEDS